LDGAGTAGLVSVVADASVLVAVGSVVVAVFFFLEKRAFNLSKGESPMLARSVRNTGAGANLMLACAGGDEGWNVGGSDV